MRQLSFVVTAVLAVVVGQFFSHPASAALGDRKEVAKALVSSASAFTVQNTDSGAVHIREYVSRSGQVFAVTWSGLTHPNLAQLLGSYYSEYVQARSPKAGMRSANTTLSDRAVVETWGHMRKLQGRAYDPSLIPTGVSVDEIQ